MHRAFLDEEDSPVMDYTEDYYTRNPGKFRAHKVREMALHNNRAISKKRAEHVVRHVRKQLAGQVIETTPTRRTWFDKRGVIHSRNPKTGKFVKVPEEL